jgi:hypothetical protein
MVARYHRLAISFAQFGHEPALTCRRVIRRLKRRLATAPERFEGSGKFIGEPEMSEAAREFLDRWMSEHVGAVPDEYRLRETVRLVALCREDAIRAGVDLADLRAAAGGNLLESILAALSAATAPTRESVA